MKKIMITLAALAMAASVQAVSVNWGGATSNSDYTDGISAGSLAYLLFSADGFSGAATKVNLTGEVIDGVESMSANNGGKIVASYTTSSDDQDAWAFTANPYASDDLSQINGYYAVLMFDADGDAKLASYKFVGEISGATAQSSGLDVQLNTDWSGSEYLNDGGYTVAVMTASVPEPTSGLLLLLGVAGLALRRRNA